MWGLLVSTISTSAADSLNPSAITQQFVLQGIIKIPKRSGYFIIPTGVTNLIGGFLAYFGLVTFIGNFGGKLLEKHGQILFTAELILRITFLVGFGFLLQSNRTESLKKQIRSLKDSEHNCNGNNEAEAARKIKSIYPMALIALGAGATLSELITALPHFAFPAILFNDQLTLLQVTFILVAYNTIYTLPLIILYFIYINAQNKLNHLYRVVKTQVVKWANIPPRGHYRSRFGVSIYIAFIEIINTVCMHRKTLAW